MIPPYPAFVHTTLARSIEYCAFLGEYTSHKVLMVCLADYYRLPGRAHGRAATEADILKQPVREVDCQSFSIGKAMRRRKELDTMFTSRKLARSQRLRRDSAGKDGSAISYEA